MIAALGAVRRNGAGLGIRARSDHNPAAAGNPGLGDVHAHRFVCSAAVGNNEPSLGYNVAYTFGFIGPIICMFFANLWLKRNDLTPTGTGFDLLEVMARNPQVVGRPWPR